MTNKNLTILLIMIEVFLLSIDDMLNVVTITCVLLQAVQSYLILKDQ